MTQKRKIFWACFFIILVGLPRLRAGENSPISAAIDQIFVPTGYDSNDQIEIVVDGHLPDTCYRLDKEEVVWDPFNHKVKINVSAQKVGPCLGVSVPFNITVKLGTVLSGKYTILSENVQAILLVNPAKVVGQDDFPYAPVDDAYIEYIPGIGHRVWIEGRFTNTCLKIYEIKVVDSGRTIQVLPFMKMTKEDDFGQPCQTTNRAFGMVTALPKRAEAGRFLVHIRSLNGRSINRVYSSPR